MHDDIDSPESFDLSAHLNSPVARTAKFNGFVRDDRSKDEERWVKKLSGGREAWLRAEPEVPYRDVKTMDLMRPDIKGGRYWEFVVVTPTAGCSRCSLKVKSLKSRCPSCGKTDRVQATKDFSQIARCNEVTMEYLLQAVLQRLATWPKGMPKPSFSEDVVEAYMKS